MTYGTATVQFNATAATTQSNFFTALESVLLAAGSNWSLTWSNAQSTGELLKVYRCKANSGLTGAAQRPSDFYLIASVQQTSTTAATVRFALCELFDTSASPYIMYRWAPAGNFANPGNTVFSDGSYGAVGNAGFILANLGSNWFTSGAVNSQTVPNIAVQQFGLSGTNTLNMWIAAAADYFCMGIDDGTGTSPNFGGSKAWVYAGYYDSVVPAANDSVPLVITGNGGPTNGNSSFTRMASFQSGTYDSGYRFAAGQAADFVSYLFNSATASDLFLGGTVLAPFALYNYGGSISNYAYSGTAYQGGLRGYLRGVFCSPVGSQTAYTLGDTFSVTTPAGSGHTSVCYSLVGPATIGNAALWMDTTV